MSSIPFYPKVFHIGEDMVSNLFLGEVEITEKIDGSQWAFGIDGDGQVVFRSKGQDLTFSEVPKMFEKAKEQVDRIVGDISRLTRGIYFYCEFLGNPSHNILKYERVPKNHLYLFAVLKEGMFISEYKTLCYYADLLEIERPSVLFYGKIGKAEDLEKFLDAESVLGGEKMEGLVVKNYNQPSGKGGWISPISAGKWVRESFKERHKTEWKGTFTAKGRLETFIESFRAEARWQKAVQHLKEKGELENAPRDIEKLMREVETDLLDEGSEAIKNGLYKIFKNDIIRKAKAGLPEWYKAQLVSRGFGVSTKSSEMR